MLNYEFTPQADRAIAAATGNREGITFTSDFPAEAAVVPCIGDEIEIEFPGGDAKVVFTVIRRRWHMVERSKGPSRISLWLDAPESAAGPKPV